MAAAAAIIVLSSAAGTPAVAAEAPVTVAGPISEPGGFSRATCPAGTQLVGGGYDARHTVNGVNNVTDGLVVFAPEPLKANTWTAQMLSGQVRAFAMCAKGSGPAPRVVLGPASERGGYSKATCPEGTQLISGGYASTPATNGLGQYVDAVDTNTPTNDNSWLAKMTIGTAQAVALCGS
ncbi:hypothetical protein AB0D84_29140 [Streptomyces sp. NPDC048193]|uniref:hypothetical protein n=1 Tax=unclassified Streptomyces TaxID=2593676 RepID=UPI003417402F